MANTVPFSTERSLSAGISSCAQCLCTAITFIAQKICRHQLERINLEETILICKCQVALIITLADIFLDNTKPKGYLFSPPQSQKEPLITVMFHNLYY